MRTLVLLLFLHGSLHAQLNWGVHAGITASVGTHTTGIGFLLRSYINYNFIQINQSTDIQIFSGSYGHRKKLLESRNAFGLILLADKQNLINRFQFDALNHNTSYRYGIGYNYVFYNDNRGTTQNSGGFVLHFGKLSIYHENDVFAGQAKDRFRTGSARVTWSDSLQQFSLGLNLWTGETSNTEWQKICTPQMPYGFRSLEDKAYGGTSHGILFVEYRRNEAFGLQPFLRAGIDSEEIRHAVQNRFFHDLIFLPRNVERSTPHYPRVDEHGCATFDKTKRRPDKPYLQLGVNDYLLH